MMLMQEVFGVEQKIRKLVADFGESLISLKNVVDFDIEGATESLAESRKLLLENATNDIMKAVEDYIEMRTSFWRKETRVIHDSTDSA